METPKWVKYVFATVVFVAASLAVVWLAGFLFFAFSKANPFGKTNFSTWWTYWEYYQANPVVAKRLIVSVIVAAALCCAVPLMIVIDLFREVQSLYGEARFANAAEIEHAGLLGKTGIIVGKWKNRFLMFGGAQFVLLAAPTRGGKGAACVVPNLMNWDESAVVLDVKLENYKMTSLYRQAHGQKLFLWAPFATDGRTHRYNNLGYISDDPRLRVTEILGLGYTFYPGLGKEAFFDDAARNLFLGLGLYLCETPSLPRTMGEILRQSSGKGKPVKTYLQGLINERNFREYGDVQITEIGQRADRANVLKTVMAVCNVSEEDADGLIDDLPCTLVENAPKAQIDKIEDWLKEVGKHVKYTVQRRLEPLDRWDGVGEPMLSMECVDALNRFLSTSDNTLSSIMATFNAPLTIWASPIVDAATSANDFDLRDLRKQRMTVYIGIPANKLAEAKLLLNVFYSQLIALNTEQQLHATPELKYTCLLINDEFAAPGRIGIIDTANSYIASYGLRLLTIIQSPQIENEPPKGYGKEGASTLITNHALQMMYTPRKQSDAEEYSRMLGTYTFKAKGKSRQVGGKNSGGHSESESDQKRPLMLPQELKVMGKRKQIISLEDTKPILCERAFFFDDHRFIDRFKSVCPTLAALDQTPIRRVLRKLGFAAKAKPSHRFFQDTWERGELSSDVPRIDLDLHEARVQQRMRPLTVDDVAQGVDLRALALDTSKLAFPEGDGVDPAQVEAFANSFFNALEAVSDEDEATPTIDADGASAPLGADMLAELEALVGGAIASAASSDADAAPTPAGGLVDGDIDLSALVDAIQPADDAIQDDAAVLASAEPENADVESTDRATSILDLSVLDRPTDQAEQ